VTGSERDAATARSTRRFGPRENRYGAFEMDDETTVIYDTRADDAWIQSTVTASLSGRR